jgi:adenylate cyclase
VSASGPGSGSGAAERLAEKLLLVGVSPDEVDAAIERGELGLLAVDRLLVQGRVELTRTQVAERAGVDLALAERLWRAMGFADLPDDEVAFTTVDVEMLATVKSYLDTGVLDEQTLVQMTRVVGGSMARVAEAQMSLLQERMAIAGLSGVEAVEFALALIAVFERNWERMFGYVHLRQLQAVTKRATFIDDDDGSGRARGPVLAVGFADLVGFTVLSQALDEHELAQVVDHFENVAYETIGRNGGRVVKMIGDEVMFVADDPADAARIGLSLSESYGVDDTVSDVRVSVACGPVLAHEGDYFGPVVNLAARLVNIAYAGSVVVSQEVYELLSDSDEFGWKPIRPRRLKGIGVVPLWAVTRPGEGRGLATEVASRIRAHRRGRKQ